jgi:hypothetical protein
MTKVIAWALFMLTAAVAQAQPASSAPASQPDATGPAKFYGTVSAVDTKAMTFTVDNQVYHIVGETHMTKASDDSKATLEEGLVGEAARGTYTKASDGSLNVTKVRFGKKTGGKASGKGKKGEDAAKPSESSSK